MTALDLQAYPAAFRDSDAHETIMEIVLDIAFADFSAVGLYQETGRI